MEDEATRSTPSCYSGVRIPKSAAAGHLRAAAAVAAARGATPAAAAAVTAHEQIRRYLYIQDEDEGYGKESERTLGGQTEEGER